jgi:uncharacterized protein HemX
MGIVIVIVLGVVVVTGIAVYGDLKSKERQAAAASATPDAKQAQDLRTRVETLEEVIREQDKKIAKLETDVSFATRLLEDKSK